MKYGFFLWVGALLALDQVTKAIIRTTIPISGSRTVIRGFLEFHHVQNEGVAFGLFQGMGIWLAPVALIVAVIAGVAYMRLERPDRLTACAVILIAAGALGNFTDRIINGGKVTDFIDIHIIHVFNVADACITVGVALLMLRWIADFRGEPGRKADATTSAAVSDDDMA